MSKELLFWIVMLIWVLFCGWDSYRTKSFAWPNLITFILFLVLGWTVYGAPLK